jgi:hypothetical protein
MRLFPQLVLEKYVERFFDVLVPRYRIVGGSKIIDQVVQPHLFLRAEVKYWSIISFDVPRFEIIIILVRKTKRKCRNCDRKESTHSRRHGRVTPLYLFAFFLSTLQPRLRRIRSTLNLAACLIKTDPPLCADSSKSAEVSSFAQPPLVSLHKIPRIALLILISVASGWEPLVGKSIWRLSTFV